MGSSLLCLGSAKSNYKDYVQGETVKLKKYLYVLRPLLACRWVLQNECPPPMLFSQLKDACLDCEVVPAVENLLEMKAKTSELGEGKRIQVINDYIDNSISEIETVLKQYPNDDNCGWDKLNKVFLEMLK